MNLNGDSAPALVCISIAVAFTVYWTVEAVAAHWRRAKMAEQTAALKQQMIEKGMPVDDIVRVIEAKPGGKADA